MTRVRPGTGDDAAQGAGCIVTGRLFGRPGGTLIAVTLDRQCAWRGHLVATRFEAYTDEAGQFTLTLPPSGALRPVDGSPAPQYVLRAIGVRGGVRFSVPDAANWELRL